jgi:hypothetical protein
MKTLYDLLGVRPDADAKALKIGFRKAIKANHPDLHPKDPRALSKFKQIVAANSILSDAVQRAAYDRSLKLERQRRRLEGSLLSVVAAISFTVALVGALWINYAPSDQGAGLTEIAAANTVGNNPYEGRNDGETIVNVAAVSKPPLAPPGSVPAMQPQSAPRPVAPAATGAMDLSPELRLADQATVDRKSLQLEWSAKDALAPAKSQQSGAADIALLMEKGAAFIAHGDVSAARVMFQRAAEAGDPRAAFALGETYDPSVLRARGGGITFDIALANSWYEKAKQLAK